MKFKLKAVSNSDIEFLFELLKNRKSYENISHKKLPTMAQHIKFVKSKPYTKWYIIFLDGKKAGSIYLSKHDEIGISVKNGFKKSLVEIASLKLMKKKIPRKRYLANVNPKNSKAIKFFKQNHFKLLQYTFEFSKTE